MKIYNTTDGTFTVLKNANKLHENGSGRTNAWQFILDNFNSRHPFGNLLFTFEAVPDCEIKYRKIALSEQADEQVGKWSQYGVGTVLEMDESEKEAVDFVPPPLPILPNWYGLEQAFWQNQAVFQKAFFTQNANAFTLLSKVFSDGKTTGASENSLQMAMDFVRTGMVEDFTEAEIGWINEQFELFNFETRIE